MKYHWLCFGAGVILSNFNVPLCDARFVGLITVLLGVLYIPTFIYGYFWLWVLPFTGMAVLFTRAMIDAAIDRVSQKGDEAVQAKAMIPEFIMMNVKMTILLSLPFITALFLVHHEQISPLQASEQDRAIWEWCLAVLKSSSKVSQLESPFMQIVLSNFFFMIVCTVSLFALAYKKTKHVFVILFHRETYKFLQNHSPAGRIAQMRSVLFVAAYLIPLPFMTSLEGHGLSTTLPWSVYLGFLIFGQFAHLTSIVQEISIQNKEL